MALKRECQVLIVGAGPVGLFAALSLAERGLNVQIIDKEWRGSVHSYALALHPGSLQLLDEYGAADDLMREGHRIERFAFYVGDARTAELDFSALDTPFPFLLVVPQSTLEQSLEQRLKQRKVKVFWNHQAQTLDQDDRVVLTKIAKLEKYSMGYPVAHTEWMISKEIDLQSSFLIGADGYHSFVRQAFEAKYEPHGQAQAFSVFEFPCRVDFQHEARVVFHEGTTNVIWPIDERHARWSFQVPSDAPPEPTVETLQRLIRERAPWFQSKIEELSWTTVAMFERRLADRFGRGRVWLAGDAAHITGPVGAQSMNVGLRESHDLAERISAVVKGAGSPNALEGYESRRQEEWSRLLGTGARLVPQDGGAPALLERAAEVLPCIPASGPEQERLLAQIGLKFA